MSDRTIDPRIHDYVDGELSDAERNRFEHDMARDPALAADVDRVRALVGDLEDLGGDRPPTRDLWPGIAARLDDRETVAHETPTGLPRGRRITLRLSQLIAAGIALVLLTGTTTWIALRAGEAVPGASVAVATDGVGTEAAQFVDDELFREYEDAVLELEVVLDAGRDRLSPETVEVLEASLAAVDTAIADARSALESDPESGPLLRLLRRHMKTKLDVLQQTAAAIQSNA